MANLSSNKSCFSFSSQCYTHPLPICLLSSLRFFLVQLILVRYLEPLFSFCRLIASMLDSYYFGLLECKIEMAVPYFHLAHNLSHSSFSMRGYQPLYGCEVNHWRVIKRGLFDINTESKFCIKSRIRPITRKMVKITHDNVDWSLFSFGKVLVIFENCARE